MGDLLRLCSTSTRLATLSRSDALWRLIFEARHGRVEDGIPRRVVATSPAREIRTTFLARVVRHVPERVISISGSLLSIQYGRRVRIPSWKMWLRLVEAELPHRDVPVTIRLVPNREGVLERLRTSFEESLQWNRTKLPQDATFLATPATYFSFPTPESMRRFTEAVGRGYQPRSAVSNQRLVEAGLLLASIQRSPTDPLEYTATLRMRVIPELGEDLPRVLRYLRTATGMGGLRFIDGVVEIDYPATP